MSPANDQDERKPVPKTFYLTLATVLGQVGCLTLVLLLAAIFFGIWLDKSFGTRPMFTLGLAIASIPVTIVAMLWVVRATTTRLRNQNQSEQIQEESNGGKTS